MAITWTEQQPAGAVNKNWYGVGINSNGTKFIAAVYGGRLYTGSEPSAEGPANLKSYMGVLKANIGKINGILMLTF